MVPGSILHLLERIFKRNLNHKSLSFGGISVILSGDPAQLPPIMSQPIFIKKQKTVSGMRGYNLYVNIARFNTVILTAIKRSKNKQYTQLQNDIRNGIFTDEMINTINSRYKKGFSNLVSAPGLIPIVTISNVQIKKWYDANSMELSHKMISNGDEPPILLLADIYCKSCRRRGDVNVLKRKRNTRITLSADELQYLDTLPDTKFDNYPMGFFLYIGANCIIAKNIATEYQLANGTRGVVVGYEFPEGHHFKLCVYHGVTVRVAYIDNEITHVRAVYFKIDTTLRIIPPGQPSGLPDNTVALVRTLNHAVNEPIEMKCQNSLYEKVWMNISQIPLRTADMLTPYSVQGSQFDRYIIEDFRVDSFYQVISRGTNGLESISLEKRITREFADKVMQHDLFRSEITRLEEFHAETKLRLEANYLDVSSYDRLKHTT